MDKKRVFIKFTIALQVFILLFATVVIPASAASGEVPPSPLILEGSIISSEGMPAPVGTEITVELNDKLVGITTVTSEGVFGDGVGNKLFITCDPDNYGDIKIYVDGLEAAVDLDSLINAEPGEFISLDFTVSNTFGVTTNSASKTVSGSGGSGSYYGGTTVEAEDNVADEDNAAVEDVDSSLMSTESSLQSDEAEDAPASESKSSMGSIGFIAVGLLLLIGVIATVKYKFQN